MRVVYSARSGGIIGIIFPIFFNMKVCCVLCCVFSLESPHRGDSNEYTQHAIINIKKKITLNYPKYNNVCNYGIFSPGTQERVRNSHGKISICVRATEVLLYVESTCSNWEPKLITITALKMDQFGVTMQSCIRIM